MAELICYVNGSFLPISEAAVPVQDLAVLRGYGVFDFLRTYHGQPFRLHDHLRRLENSARLVHLALPRSPAELGRIVKDTLKRNDLPEANIRIVVTGGVASDGITPPPSSGLLVLITPVKLYPAADYEQGVKVITVEHDRYLPRAKTINYIPAIMALKQAKAAGAAEALYVNRQQHVLEGTTTNFFIFHDNQLVTPRDDILPGVTRDVVLSLAREKFDVVERPLTFDDLAHAGEAFITASNKEVMPVRQVNNLIIGPGLVGPNTRWLIDRFREITWRKRK